MADADLAAAAVLLCAHGRGGEAESHYVPESLARALRGRFARVECCYLRGSPQLADVVAGVEEEHIYLVPLLMADGYTNQVLLPQALAEAGKASERVVTTPPLGADPSLSALVIEDAMARCRAFNWTASETTVLIAGHGTGRHPDSAKSAVAVADAVAASGRFRRAFAAFLEQEPLIEAVLREIRPGPCVVTGFFLDHGGHSADDMPRLIAEAHPDAAYSGAIGAHPGMADLIFELVLRTANRGGP